MFAHRLQKQRDSFHLPPILRVLPVPKFLELSTSGLDISDTHLRVVTLDRGKHTLRVKEYGEEELPQGLIQGGDVQNPVAFSALLKEFAKKYALRFVRVSLPEEKAYLFKTVIPRVPRKEMQHAVEFRLEENVPLSLSEIVSDYAIAESAEDHADHFDVEVAVLPKKTAESFVEVFKSAGLQPVSFIIEAQAVARSLIKKGDATTRLIVNIEAAKTGLYVAQSGVVHFASTAPIGGAVLSSALEKELKLDRKEAEKKKLTEGLLHHRDHDELFFALMTPLSALKDEIKKIITFWDNHEEEKQGKKQLIVEILLCGKDAMIPGLKTYLQEALKKPVVVGNVWSNVLSLDEEIPAIPHDESLDYAAAVGAALIL